MWQLDSLLLILAVTRNSSNRHYFLLAALTERALGRNSQRGHHRVSDHRGCVCGTFYARAVCQAALKRGSEQIPDQFSTLIGHEACSQGKQRSGAAAWLI
jgi:hypothetical protein